MWRVAFFKPLAAEAEFFEKGEERMDTEDVEIFNGCMICFQYYVYVCEL